MNYNLAELRAKWERFDERSPKALLRWDQDANDWFTVA